ncbi:RHS repeat-associated core domain-containing protein, partial [bacterium]|nr:RHS repeat-associated core domain-containing protein [bacterium]
QKGLSGPTDWHADRLVAHYEYDPYGNRTNEPAQGEPEQPFQFSTHQFDPETGLLYAKNRYYSSRLGRWLTRDPIGEGVGENVYAYAGNVPILRLDPLGLDDIGPAPYDRDLDRLYREELERRDSYNPLKLLGSKQNPYAYEAIAHDALCADMRAEAKARLKELNRRRCCCDYRLDEQYCRIIKRSWFSRTIRDVAFWRSPEDDQPGGHNFMDVISASQQVSNAYKKRMDLYKIKKLTVGYLAFFWPQRTRNCPNSFIQRTRAGWYRETVLPYKVNMTVVFPSSRFVRAPDDASPGPGKPPPLIPKPPPPVPMRCR